MIRQLRRSSAVARYFPVSAVRRRLRHRRALSYGALECSELLEQRLLLSATSPIDFEPIQVAESLTDDAGTVITIDPTPTVAWNVSDSSVTYEVWGNEVGVEARQFFASELTEPQFTPQTPLHDGCYRIFVRAEFADGSLSNWSSPFDMVVRSSSLTQPVGTFAQSLTWVPRPEAEQWSTTLSETVVQNVVLPEEPDELVAVLPTTDDTEWLTTSSTLDLNTPAVQSGSLTKQKPKLDLAEADPNAVESPDGVEPGDKTDENDPKRDPEDKPAEPDTPNIDRPDIKRIAEEPNPNGMAWLNEATSPRVTVLSRVLDAESADIDRAFAELATRGLLTAL